MTIRASLAALLLLLAGCCYSNTPARYAYSCRAVNHYRLASGFSDKEQEEIGAAMHAWATAVGECFEPYQDRGDIDLYIHFGTREDMRWMFSESAYLQEHAIGATWRMHDVYLLPSDASPYEDFEATAAHELGHFLGLSHANEGLMLWQGGSLGRNGEIPQTTVDQYWREH